MTNSASSQIDESATQFGDRHADVPLWKPIPLLSTLRAALTSTKERRLVVVWVAFIVVCAGSSVAMEFVDWAGIPVQAGPLTIYLTVYLPIVLCTFALLWVGFAWAAIAAFVATLAGALVAGMPAGWAVVFACADPVWLGVYALAYRVAPLRVDLRSVSSAMTFVALSMAASFAGSTGSFIYATTHQLGPNETFAIWEGWWLGGFLQAVVLNLPVFILAGPAVARIRSRVLPASRRPSTSGWWVGAAVLACCLALAVFVAATGHLGSHRLTALRDVVAPTAGADLDEALWALNLMTWHSLVLVAIGGVGALILAVAWSRSLRTEVASRTSELEDSRLRYALAAKASNDGLWDWDLAAQRVHFSPRWKEMLGYGEAEVGDRIEDWLQLVHPEERKQLEVALNAHIDGHTSSFEGEYRLRHKDGEYRTMLSRGLCVRLENGTATRMAGSQTDVSDRRASERQLIHDALHDELTGLPNRTLFLDRLGGAIARAKRQESYLFSVLFLDIDRFKAINDSLGHRVGDLLLQGISERLTSCLRPVDTVARLGGDEFAILLDNISSTQNATELADRIHQQLSRPFVFDATEVFTSTSIGIASSRTGYNMPEDVLRDADTAMYRAKSLGKARHQVFDTAMHAQTLRLLLLETDLRQALDKNELVLHYQPVLDLKNRTAVGCEALLRWVHPRWGIVPQKEFLPLAEETGLIVPIGEWVFKEACRQLAEWRRTLPGAGKLTVALNLSEKQLAHPVLAGQLAAALDAHRLDAGALRAEVTEDAIAANRDGVVSSLDRLEKLGVAIDLDDFGTGVSSLSLLHSLPLSAVKIDRSWVAGLGTDPRADRVVAGLVELGITFGLSVVAEGVETEEQASRLVELGCHWAQGYLFSNVLTPNEFSSYIRGPS